MGHSEETSDPGAAALVAFAAGLLALRDVAGNPSHEELARRSLHPAAELSAVATGRVVPSFEATLAYVRACGGDEYEWVRRWYALHERLSAAWRPDRASDARPAATPAAAGPPTANSPRQAGPRQAGPRQAPEQAYAGGWTAGYGPPLPGPRPPVDLPQAPGERWAPYGLSAAGRTLAPDPLTYPERANPAGGAPFTAPPAGFADPAPGQVPQVAPAAAWLPRQPGAVPPAEPSRPGPQEYVQVPLGPRDMQWLASPAKQARRAPRTQRFTPGQGWRPGPLSIRGLQGWRSLWGRRARRCAREPRYVAGIEAGIDRSRRLELSRVNCAAVLIVTGAVAIVAVIALGVNILLSAHPAHMAVMPSRGGSAPAHGASQPSRRASVPGRAASVHGRAAVLPPRRAPLPTHIAGSTAQPARGTSPPARAAIAPRTAPPASPSPPRSSPPTGMAGAATVAVAKFPALTGVGCPRAQGTAAAAGVRVPDGDGWTRVRGGLAACGGQALASRKTGRAGLARDTFTWTFRTGRPAVCFAEVFIAAARPSSGLAHYGVYGTSLGPGQQIGQFKIDQRADKGQWIAEGPWYVPVVLHIQLTDLPAFPGDRFHVTASAVRAFCA